MKLQTHHFLDERNILYTPLTFPETIDKGAASVARTLGYRERQMVKTLIFVTAVNEHVLVMVGGDQKAISGHLKKAIGSKNIKMASFDAIKAVTGYEVGSIPPFHWQPAGFRSFLEASLLEEEILGVGAGVWGNEIMITPSNLLLAAGATAVNLTKRGQSIFPEL
ncbi:MAG: YbaK/EbsC family protein [Chloroflexota bacterium]